MATISFLLVVLCLFSGSHQLKIHGPSLQTGWSGKVKLECHQESGDSIDFGVFWFRQKKDGKNPESIVFLSNTKKPQFSNEIHKDKFVPDRTGSMFILTLNAFQQTDQGTYYCMVNKNSVLHISPGFSLVYPEVTTPKPAPTKSTTTSVAIFATAKGKEDECGCPPGNKDSSKDALNLGFTCDLLVWAPLTGLCSLLLVCLLVTSILLCCRSRRRRCRCKHKPLNEMNGNMAPPRKPR